LVVSTAQLTWLAVSPLPWAACAAEPAPPEAARTFDLALGSKNDRTKAAVLIRQAIAIERKQRGETLQLATYQAALCSYPNQAGAGKLFAQVYSLRKAKAPNPVPLLNETAVVFFSS
jgi:hypothetical protein